MFKLGEAAGILATTSKYCNCGTKVLQQQHNDKCTLKKLMEYSLDTFGKKDNDSGECSAAAEDGDSSAQSQQQQNQSKRGCCGRRGVTTAKSCCGKTPGQNTNTSTKSSCCGGCCGAKTKQYKNNELTQEQLAKKTCAATPKTWREVLDEELSTVAQYAGNVANGIKGDFCASMPFPECKNCPHRPELGAAAEELSVPQFMQSVETAIDALTAGAPGVAIEAISCPGIAAALASGDYGALDKALVHAGIASLITATIASGSVSTYNTLLSILPMDMQLMMKDPRFISQIMETATSGSSTTPSSIRKAARNLNLNYANQQIAAVKIASTAACSLGSTQKFLESATPAELGAFIATCQDDELIKAAILAAGDEAQEVVTQALACRGNSMAPYVNGVYTGCCGANSAGADLSWFDELVNTFINVGCVADDIISVGVAAANDALGITSGLFGVSDREMEAIKTINAVDNQLGRIAEHTSRLVGGQAESCYSMMKSCASIVDAATTAIDVCKVTSPGCSSYRVTQLPGCSYTQAAIEGARVVDRVMNGDVSDLIETAADFLLW